MRRPACLTAVMLLAGFLPAPSPAATLNVVGEQLLGAFNVDVGGQLYDVEFVDGTCIALFDGCDDAFDFTFQTETTAVRASQALFDQVFLDGSSGPFDSAPYFTAGCDDNWCHLLTPFGLNIYGDFLAAQALNAPLGYADEVTRRVNYDLDFDTEARIDFAFAFWTPVPEPSTGLLMAAGLALLSARRRCVAGR